VGYVAGNNFCKGQSGQSEAKVSIGVMAAGEHVEICSELGKPYLSFKDEESRADLDDR
jgi:hypothetical protein